MVYTRLSEVTRDYGWLLEVVDYWRLWLITGLLEVMVDYWLITGLLEVMVDYWLITG